MVDAPCSGEGMFRKNPAVVDSWKEKRPGIFFEITAGNYRAGSGHVTSRWHDVLLHLYIFPFGK